MQSYSDQFHALGTMLQCYRQDWQQRPFTCQHWPFDDFSEAQLSSGAALAMRPLLAPWLDYRLPEASKVPLRTPTRLASGIGGRKWQQITDFAGAADVNGPALEWCAGKGHLGRLLAVNGQAVLSLELQLQLCQQGETLAQHWQVPQQFVCADALTPAAAQFFEPARQALALHACGRLHMTFLRQAVNASVQRLTLSPCCYHLIDDEHYQPMSQQGRQQQLSLSRFDLKLPLEELVTGGARAGRLRQQENRYRLAFDALQQDLGGEGYLPVPSAPKTLFNGSFADFAGWAAAQKGLTLPPSLDSEYYLAVADARLPLINRINQVRHWYRRPLELWLLLDRVCYLQEAGYKVSLSTFTDHHNTPRNALIDATKEPV
ncbi:methyltransferase [Gallaecimonas sp. GXIMD1310]|uniref:methyltransferase n=1 Tax=Gallaecimonas sp. GXIMD1310 TaxID=3131926 RepID=UPI0032532592